MEEVSETMLPEEPERTNSAVVLVGQEKQEAREGEASIWEQRGTVVRSARDLGERTGCWRQIWKPGRWTMRVGGGRCP